MKQTAAAGLCVLFIAWELVDTLQDFVARDPVTYFRLHPAYLLLAGGIAVACGLVAYIFSRLSFRRQRQIKLLILGMAASFVTLVGGILINFLAKLPSQIDPDIGKNGIILTVLLCTMLVGGVLWFECFQVFKSDNQ